MGRIFPLGSAGGSSLQCQFFGGEKLLLKRPSLGAVGRVPGARRPRLWWRLVTTRGSGAHGGSEGAELSWVWRLSSLGESRRGRRCCCSPTPGAESPGWGRKQQLLSLCSGPGAPAASLGQDKPGEKHVTDTEHLLFSSRAALGSPLQLQVTVTASQVLAVTLDPPESVSSMRWILPPKWQNTQKGR